jgi:hypothetical protein
MFFNFKQKTDYMIKLILTVLLTLTGNCFADVLRDNNDDLLVFVVNQDNVPVYLNLNGESSTPGLKLSLADSYVASIINTEKRKLLLSQIILTESGVQIDNIGWVDAKYILGGWNYDKQRFLPRKKSMAIYEAPEGINTNRKINNNPNTLPFRILFKQEGERVKTTKEPGVDSFNGKIQYGFVWYYVYDTRNVNGELFYLIGKKRSLFKIDPDTSIDKATETHIKSNLLGWVKSEHFIIWPTNLAFEYVTTIQAVSERFSEKRPGVIYKNIPEQGDNYNYNAICESSDSSDKISACEPLTEWWEAIFNDKNKLESYDLLNENQKIKKCLCDESKYHCLDPCGLDRNIQRFHLMQELSDGWFNVATLGDIGVGSGSLSSSKSYEIFINALAISKALDLVFIVDATGSMSAHIEKIKNFISSINNKLKELQDKHSVQMTIPGDINRTLTAKMDVNISILLFQDVGKSDIDEDSNCYQSTSYQTCILVNAKSLRSNAGEINKALTKLIEKEARTARLFQRDRYKYLRGGNEALYEGINRALSEKSFWRHYTSEKFLVILTDEPGDKGSITKQMILDKRISLRKTLAAESGISISEQDNKNDTLLEFIGIWALYVKNPKYKASCFDTPCPDGGHDESFKQRLEQITYSSGPLDRVKDINYHSKTSNASDKEKDLIVILSKRLLDANDAILEKTNRFSEQELNKIKEKLDNNSLLDQPAAAIIKDQQVIAAIGGRDNLVSLIDFLGNSHFVSGVLKKQYDKLEQPTYKKVLLFQRDELISYEEALRVFTSKFDKYLKTGLSRTEKNVSKVIITSILLAIAKITDDEEAGKLFKDERALNRAVIGLNSRVQSQDSLRLADLMGYQTVLPDQGEMNNSLFSMRVKDIINVPRGKENRKKHIKKLKHAIKQVQTKIFCLDKIITGNKAPNNPKLCQSYTSSEKDWRYIHPVSGDSYYYVPLQFIP